LQSLAVTLVPQVLLDQQDQLVQLQLSQLELRLLVQPDQAQQLQMLELAEQQYSTLQFRRV
jgi:hypothetical protein